MGYPTHGPEYHERDTWKRPVRAATTANITISTALNNGDSLDGVTLATGDRVLVKDQSTGSQNGIYVVGASPARAVDYGSGAEVVGSVIVVLEGTANADTMWLCTTNAAITVGSTALVFAAVGGGGSAFTPVTVYAESNTPGTTHATPNTLTNVPFDTFYDVDQDDLVGVLPASLGLTYNGSDQFVADEDGVWILHIGMDITVNPGSTGRIRLNCPVFGYGPNLNLAASGNPPDWITERTITMRAGEFFYMWQFSAAGSSVTLIDGYAVLDITRIATSVS